MDVIGFEINYLYVNFTARIKISSLALMERRREAYSEELDTYAGLTTLNNLCFFYIARNRESSFNNLLFS